MKKLLLLLLVGVLAIGTIMVTNAFRHGPAPRAKGSVVPMEAMDDNAIAEHLAAAIRFRTVSHQDPKDDDRAAFAEFRKFLTATYQPPSPAPSGAATRSSVRLCRSSSPMPSSCRGS